MSDGVEQVIEGAEPAGVSALNEIQSAPQEPEAPAAEAPPEPAGPRIIQVTDGPFVVPADEPVTGEAEAEQPVDAAAPAPDLPFGIQPLGFEALRAQTQAKKDAEAAELAELGSLECELDITPIRLRRQRFYVQDPSMKERELLKDFFDDLERRREALQPGPDGEPVGPDGKTVDLDKELFGAIAPFVCRYEPALRDLKSLTVPELEAVVGLRSIPRLIGVLLGVPEMPGRPGDPN